MNKADICIYYPEWPGTLKTATEKYTHKNKGVLRGTAPPVCQALSISNTTTLQQMQILLCKANKDMQQNKQKTNILSSC